MPRLSDFHPGDTVIVQPRHACLIHGLATVEADPDGELFVHCAQGFHYLQQFQTGPDGELGGVEPVRDDARAARP